MDFAPVAAEVCEAEAAPASTAASLQWKRRRAESAEQRETGAWSGDGQRSRQGYVNAHPREGAGSLGGERHLRKNGIRDRKSVV